MLVGRKSLQLLPDPGRQGPSTQASLSFSDIWNCPDHTWRFYVLVASGAAADARGLRTGSGSLLRFGRGLRDGQPWLPVLSLHAGGEAQRPESYLPAHRHQAGEGTQWENSVEFMTGGVFTGVSHTQDTWLYHLMVAAGSSAAFDVGTEYERLIGTLLDADGDPGGHTVFRAAATCYFDPQTASIQAADCVYDWSSMREAASAVESFETRLLCVCSPFPRIGLVEERGLELL